MILFLCYLTYYVCFIFVFFNDTATTEIYTYLHTLSLHDALPICPRARASMRSKARAPERSGPHGTTATRASRTPSWADREYRAADRAPSPDRKSTRLNSSQ